MHAHDLSHKLSTHRCAATVDQTETSAYRLSQALRVWGHLARLCVKGSVLKQSLPAKRPPNPPPRMGATRARNVATGGTRAHSTVAEAIGQRIVHGEYLPGTILPNEAQWASQYDVGRSVIREAIKILMAKGLLTSRPKIGSRVEPKQNWNLMDREVLAWWAANPDNENALHSLQQFRRIFEPEAAALAALHHDDAQMQAISAACDDMAAATGPEARALADMRFHLHILQASGNELLVPFGGLIESALRNLFAQILQDEREILQAQSLHQKVERAIAARDPDGARQAVLDLLDNSDRVIGRLGRRKKP